ncbi:MAG: CPBP family intramembrane metalloprotease [Myxococcales bacterium]|nr:MAG: CPBP family intramembrane metalloprotease [Myxococcales bacterium]
MLSGGKALKQAFRSYAIVAIVTALVVYLPVAWFQQHLAPLLLALFLLWTALHFAVDNKDNLARHGLSLGGFFESSSSEKSTVSALLHTLPAAFKSLALAALTALIVFPPFIVAYLWWWKPDGAFHWQWPAGLLSYALNQLFVVALPEEAFFRGYLQTRLADGFRTQRKVFGVSLSLPAWLMQAALFALLHFLAPPHPSRFAVFFPALVFGWLRRKEQSIGASVWFHAMSNILSFTLARGFA